MQQRSHGGLANVKNNRFNVSVREKGDVGIIPEFFNKFILWILQKKRRRRRRTTKSRCVRETVYLRRAEEPRRRTFVVLSQSRCFEKKIP